MKSATLAAQDVFAPEQHYRKQSGKEPGECNKLNNRPQVTQAIVFISRFLPGRTR
jgi:hypothetical protein